MLAAELKKLSAPFGLILAAVFGHLLFAPPQFVIEVGPILLPPYRVFLLGSTIYVAVQLLSGRLRLGWADLFVILASVWIFVALAVTTDVERALEAGGAQFVDFAVCYLFSRCVFTTLRDLRTFLILMAPILAATGLLLAAESVTQQFIGQPFAASITGGAVAQDVVLRLGLMRAMGPFPHPILAGLMLGSLFAPFLLSGLRGWPKLAGLAGAACSFFTLSSAAMLGLVVGGALVAANWLTERIANLGWRLILAGLAIVAFILQFATGAGVAGLLVRFASLNAESSYYRVLIWRYGSETVADNPVFGVGYAEWERPIWMSSSVDNYWLLLAIQFGLLTPVLIILAAVLAVVGLARSSRYHSISDQRTLRGLAISLAVFTLALFSVAVWLSPQAWFFMLLGICVGLGQSYTKASGVADASEVAAEPKSQMALAS